MNIYHQINSTTITQLTYQNILSLSGNIDVYKKTHILTNEYKQLTTLYDPVYAALWCVLKTKPIPVFTCELLDNIREIQDTVAELKLAKPMLAPKYIIWLSDNCNVFNLGLDLNLLSSLIIKRDEKHLEEYLQKCIDVLYINLMKLDLYPVITISLIRGKVYGGGLEAALSSDIIFAEENAKCCFPEVHYNLFPSLGTLDKIMEKVNKNDLKNLILHGKHLNLNILQSMGLVDELVEQGKGCQTAFNYIKKAHSKHCVYASLYKDRLNQNVITYEKLTTFKKQWIDVALHLQYSDLRRLEKIAQAQAHLII